MRLFLETSSLIKAGPNLSAQKLMVLRRQLQAERVPIITCQVVIDECVTKFREDLASKRSAVEAAVRKLEHAVAQQFLIQISDEQVEKWVDAYRASIGSIFSDDGCMILPYPSVDHEETARRAMNDIRPYKKGNKDGYRDALIWFSILEALEEDPDDPIRLITDNSSDFGEVSDGSYKLHRQLQEDIRGAGGDTDAVTIASSTESIIEQYIESQIRMLEGAREEILAGVWSKRSIDDDTSGVVVDYFMRYPISDFAVDYIPSGDGLEVGAIQEVLSVDYRDVKADRALFGGYSLRLDVVATCEFEIAVDKFSSYMDELREITAEDDEKFYGVTELTVPCTVSIVYQGNWEILSTGMSLGDGDAFEVLYSSWH